MSSCKFVQLIINGKRTNVPDYSTILRACSSIGVRVPTLCNHPRLPATGICRICLVEVDGKLLPACVSTVKEGMIVQTDTDKVKSSIKSNLELLRAGHPNVCMTCEANGKCEFQDLIYEYGVEEKYPNMTIDTDYYHEWDDLEVEVDESTDSIKRDMSKCISCGRCVTACGFIQNMNIIGFLGRGGERKPGTFANLPLDFTQCIECGQCALYCPTGAITEKSHLHEVMAELSSKKKIMIAQTAPAVRVTIGEEVFKAPGEIQTGVMISALRALGFDYVFDTNFGADLTIMEEGSELLQRLNNNGSFPMFTSCCPAWVSLVEKNYPHLIENLSTARSPQQMLGSLVKTHFAKKLAVPKENICLVSIMPCTAKKHESRRPEFSGDVDYVLTTREFGHLLRSRRIPVHSLASSEFDEPLGMSTGAGALFGVTGGVMEAAVRTAQVLSGLDQKDILALNSLEQVRGLEGVKSCSVLLQKSDGSHTRLNIAVVNGTGNTRHLLENREVSFDFIEVMACPGGCIGGGGQPKSKDPDILSKRMNAIYRTDQASKIRKSHENPAIHEIYKNFLDSPLSDKSHELLHTTYTNLKSKSKSTK